MGNILTHLGLDVTYRILLRLILVTLTLVTLTLVSLTLILAELDLALNKALICKLLVLLGNLSLDLTRVVWTLEMSWALLCVGHLTGCVLGLGHAVKWL